MLLGEFFQKIYSAIKGLTVTVGRHGLYYACPAAWNSATTYDRYANLVIQY